jgi:hypothetical protein
MFCPCPSPKHIADRPIPSLPYRYIRTPILPPKVQEYLDGKGVGFALVEDCCRAMLFIASNPTINGKREKMSPDPEP